MCVQSRLTVCHPVDCGPQGFSVRGISQARIPEWVNMSSSRGSSPTRDRTLVSYNAVRFFMQSSGKSVPDSTPWGMLAWWTKAT